MSTDIKAIHDSMLVYPKEKILFILSAVFSVILWISLVIATLGFGLLLIGIGALIFLFMKHLFMARIKGFGICVSENQYPEMYEQVTRIANDMGLKNIPAIYILQMEGILNAFALNIFSRRFVIVTTATLDACAEDTDALAFILAHEVSHLARKHTNRIEFLLPSRIIPWLGNAYSRACEYTADAYGAKYGTTSLEKAQQGISILATASIARSRSLNAQAYINQARDVRSFWPAVANTNSTHPFTSLRYARIASLAQQTPSHPRSNIFGFLLAPLFSIYTLFVIYIVVVIAVSLSNASQM